MSREKLDLNISEKLKNAEEHARLIHAEIVALENKQEVLDIISSCTTIAEAHSNLETRFNLDHEQSRRITEMRFCSLSRQRVDETHQAYNQTLALINELKS